jgi:recombination DNA repair RAD52 pathway protein
MTGQWWRHNFSQEGMMVFVDYQIKALSAKLSRNHVRVRESNSLELSFVEGWYVITEANRIFGFDGWDRETVEAQCVWESRERTIRQVRILPESGRG